MEHFIGTKFQKEGKEYSFEQFSEYQMHVLYFGASWSPPCQKLFPHLESLYHSLNASSKALEILYITCEFTEQDFQDNLHLIPFSYIPFSEIGLREIITRHYSVIGIPTLLLIDPQGTCVSNSLLLDLSKHNPSQCQEIWLKILSDFL